VNTPNQFFGHEKGDMFRRLTLQNRDMPMARGYKTGGRQKGSLNRRTTARNELQSRHGIDAASPALVQMRICAARLLDLADVEQRKGELADQRLIKENIDSAARILREICQYEIPKLTAVRIGGHSDNSIPIDIQALTDDQLYSLIDRLTLLEKLQ
jgi:hypothetical protein